MVRPFTERLQTALSDPDVRAGLTAFQRGWRQSRDTEIAALESAEGRSFDELRRELAGIKDAVLADHDTYLQRFVDAARRAGSEVVFAADAAEANAAVLDVCRQAGADVVVKGKSMVSEEIGLNDHLAAAGVTPVETDLGEWILQLAGELPSHLVMPAIHKRREEVAALLGRVLGRPFDPDDVDAMVHSVRGELRERFLASGVGLSGANALVAESGSVLLVCNEGNNRMSVALPGVHVVTAGIEKLVPTYADAITQIRLLARSATGQPITVYTNFVTGPRPGQRQVIVLVDNGRSAMAEDPDTAAALRCIRCGACANVCPPYGVVGGHAFGHVYTGAIGLVNTAFHHDLDDVAGPQSLCVSCGACATVCPVDIPLPTQILEVRRRVHEAAAGTGRGRTTAIALAAWRRPWLADVGLRLASMVTAPWRDGEVTRLPAPVTRLAAVRRHTSWRTPPALPRRPARDQLRTGRLAEPPVIDPAPLAGRRVLVFLQCLADRLAPSIAVDAARLLRAAGAEVVLTRAQHCCGLPAYDAGDHDAARRMLEHTAETFAGVDDVVTPAASCFVMLRRDAPHLFRGDVAAVEEAQQLAGRVYDLVEYLTVGPGRLPDGALDNGDRTPVAVHRFCHATNTLDRGDVVEGLLRDVAGVRVTPLDEAEVCCGFGGSTSASHPEVAAGILARKLSGVRASGAPVLVTDNPGCVLHLRGGVDAAHDDVRVLHLAEFLAGRLGDRPPVADVTDVT